MRKVKGGLSARFEDPKLWQPRVISSILVRYLAATLKQSAIGHGTISCHPDKFQDLRHPIIFLKYQVTKTFIAGITNFVYALQCLIFPIKQVQFVLQKTYPKRGILWGLCSKFCFVYYMRQGLQSFTCRPIRKNRGWECDFPFYYFLWLYSSVMFSCFSSYWLWYWIILYLIWLSDGIYPVKVGDLSIYLSISIYI